MSGIVYVLTNSCMPGLVKIGMTTRGDMNIRLKELYTTGVPVPFDCEYACEVTEKDCGKIEKALHKAFSPNRINTNREFFKIEVEQVTAILELFDRKEVTNEVIDELDSSLTADDKLATEKVKIERRPALNFFTMGLQSGTVLNYIKDATITCIISDKNHVIFEGEEVSLTSLTTKLLKSPRSVRPTGYWLYQDKNLNDIYNKTYSKNDEL